MKRYIIRRLSKFSEQDDYVEGCLPDTRFFANVDVSFDADTIEGVIKKAADFVSAMREDIQRNACEEPGRVDFQVMENVDGYPMLSDAEIHAWKKGQHKAYLCCYTAHVEAIEPVTIPESEKENA